MGFYRDRVIQAGRGDAAKLSAVALQAVTMLTEAIAGDLAVVAAMDAGPVSVSR